MGNSLLAVAAEVQHFLQEQGFGFCFIGGLAVQHWGEPRVTRDVDVSVLAGFGREREVIARLLDSPFSSRMADAAEFAFASRTLLLQSASGVGIDVSLAALPFEEVVVSRSVLVEYGEPYRLRICSAEDLLIYKLFAARRKDWMDAEGVVERQRGKLDWDLVEQALVELAELKGEPEIMVEMRRLRGLRGSLG